MKDIVFICGANDFHAMDKYILTLKSVKSRRVLLLTDTIENGSQPKLITIETIIFRLFIIDRFIFSKSSSLANIWRNLIKILVIPFQVSRLKKFYREHPDCVFHAIPMYYMLLCYISKVPFVGTPQGSEILVRPFKSKIYRKYAIKSLRAAKNVIVDSVNMCNKVFELSEVTPLILKNGFDTDSLTKRYILNKERADIISIRGLNPLYRIEEIIAARNNSIKKLPLSFVYPAAELDYKKKIMEEVTVQDHDLGRLNKEDLYELMSRTLLAISIPVSDSSPRSVYECIFAGACVAVTYSPYIDELPCDMKRRIYIIDIKDRNWFDNAATYAIQITKEPFLPSEAALNMCDEKRTIRNIIEKIYS